MSTLEKLEAVKKYLQEKPAGIIGNCGTRHMFFYIANANELTNKEKAKIGDQKVLAIIKGHWYNKNDTLLTVRDVNNLSDKEKEIPIINRDGVLGVIKGKSGAGNFFLAIIDPDYVTPQEKAKLGSVNGLTAVIAGQLVGIFANYNILLAIVNTESIPEKITGAFGIATYKKPKGVVFGIRGSIFLLGKITLDIVTGDYMTYEKNVLNQINATNTNDLFKDGDRSLDPFYNGLCDNIFHDDF